MSDPNELQILCGDGRQISEYLDGRAKPAERARFEEHLAGFAPPAAIVPRVPASLWARLTTPVLFAIPFVDASLRRALAVEHVRRSLWAGLPARGLHLPPGIGPMAVWDGSMPRLRYNDPYMTGVAGGCRFRNDPGSARARKHEFLSTVDALSELPASADRCGSRRSDNDTRDENLGSFPILNSSGRSPDQRAARFACLAQSSTDCQSEAPPHRPQFPQPSQPEPHGFWGNLGRRTSCRRRSSSA